MKCQSLFSGNNKRKSYIILSTVEFAQKELKINAA